MSYTSAPRLTVHPVPSVASPEQYATSAATVDGTTVITIQLSNEPFAKVGLVRFKAKHEAGSALNFTPRIYSASGVTAAGDIAQEYAGASTAVATLFDPSISAPVPMQTDENGCLYLVLAPDAGADNQFTYALRFIVYG